MTYKCKICGGQATIDSNNGIVICDYCGTKQALPLFTADSERLLYDRGNNYLLHSEYDKAENIFNQLLTIKPGAAELYWDLVLCKYGVTYVKDPKTGKYIPTCNRTHYTSIFSDENYKKAIELSAGEKKALFEEDAKTIDNIQKGIIAVSRKEKPFDIFISYKETDANGNRTKDSIEAQKLYEKLTEAGYKVFFSRITLEDKAGTQYEPYIYAALSSSRVMLTVSSSRENIEAVWVKNEWSRYLTLRQQDAKKMLIPLYFDMEKSGLPEEFAILSAQDMGKEGFEQELLRGIKKLIPLPIMLAQKRKKLKKTLGITAATLCVILLALTAIFLPGYMKEKRYTEAWQLFENAAYEDARGEFLKLEDYKDSQEMAHKCTIQPDYDAAMQLFNNGHYTEAACAFEKIIPYEDAAQMKEKADAAYVKSVKLQKYNAAKQLYYDGNYPAAAWAFKELAGYDDAADLRDKAERAWRESLADVAIVSDRSLTWGSYYVSATGAVETFDIDSGNQHDNIEINAHGKIVSIADEVPLYALYEDGYVFNSASNNELDEDWKDVIQITPVFDQTNVALKNDGTVVYGKIIEKDIFAEDGVSDDWLKPVSSWKNIVALSYTLSRDTYGNVIRAALAGIDIEGNVHLVCSDELSQQFISELHNIKKLSIEFSCNDPFGMDFAALDTENNLIVSISGEISKIENCNYTYAIVNRTVDSDWNFENKVYVLNNKGVLSELNNRKAVMEDVVYINNSFLVTRSGNIYMGYSTDWEKPTATDGKTEVKNVWLDGNG